MKKLLITGIIALVSAFSAKADEGMWLPSLISQRITDMQSKGFRLSAEDIYNINQASLKDAVVLFGRGCTGELISPEGLLLTNHHCGYGQIQKHSRQPLGKHSGKFMLNTWLQKKLLKKNSRVLEKLW